MEMNLVVNGSLLLKGNQQFLTLKVDVLIKKFRYYEININTLEVQLAAYILTGTRLNNFFPVFS